MTSEKNTNNKSDWIMLKPAEVEKLVVELGKKNMSPALIGTKLRDSHGIPKSRIFGKKISRILKEHKVEIFGEEDRINKKVNTLRKHFTKHRHDYSAQRSIVKQSSRLNTIKKQKI